MSLQLLIEQILMDEQIENSGTIGIDDVIRELKTGVHEIEYLKTVKERVGRGKYEYHDEIKTYQITKDPSIYNGIEGEEDAEENASMRRDPKVRAGMNAVHRLVTVFDMSAKTFKTLKYANILKFDGIEVDHDDESNPVTAAHKKTGDDMYQNYKDKVKGVYGYKTPVVGRKLSGIVTDTSIKPKNVKNFFLTKDGAKKVRGAQHMFRNRSNNFEDETGERIY